MDKPDYQIGGLMLCGDCGEPTGRGDWENPSEGGISGCNNPECVRNKLAVENPKDDA
jgi:hypothetical protein